MASSLPKIKERVPYWEAFKLDRSWSPLPPRRTTMKSTFGPQVLTHLQLLNSCYTYSIRFCFLAAMINWVPIFDATNLILTRGIKCLWILLLQICCGRQFFSLSCCC